MFFHYTPLTAFIIHIRYNQSSMGNQISKDIEQAKIYETSQYGTRNQRLAQSKSLDNQLKPSRNHNTNQNLNSLNLIKPLQTEVNKNCESLQIPQKDSQLSYSVFNHGQKLQDRVSVSQRQIGQTTILRANISNLKIVNQKHDEQYQHEKSDHESINKPEEESEIPESQQPREYLQEIQNSFVKVQQKGIIQKKEFKWGNFKLEQNERAKTFIKSKHKSYQVFSLVSSDEEQQKSERISMRIQQDQNLHLKREEQSASSSSSFEEQLLIDEQEEVDNQHSQMIDEQLEDKPSKVVKKQAKVQIQEHVRFKQQYNSRNPEQMGIFQWNELQDITQMQLEEEEMLLLEFENQVKQKGQIQSPHLLQKIKHKIYLKSIDALVSEFNYNIFTNLEELKDHQDYIKVGFRKQKKYSQMFGQLWQVNDQNEQPPVLNVYGQQNHTKIHPFGRQNSHNSNPFEKPPIFQPGQKLQMVFMLDSDSTMTVGASRLISNFNEKYKNEYLHDSFYRSLQFLLRNQILQVQTAKVSESPYKSLDPGQVYQSTRAASSIQNLTLWRKKMEAEYEITIPLTLNLVNYYNYVCRQKLKQPPAQQKPRYEGFLIQPQPSQNKLAFSIQVYKGILITVQEHIRRILTYLKKSKFDQTIKNQITKVRLQLANPSQIQAPQQKEGSEKQQSDDEYDFDTVSKLNNLNPNSKKFSDQQVSKQDLEKLFESGNWFSLHSSKVQHKNPSPYFQGKLKKFQQLTLAWMLFRQNCKIHYEIDRPHQHFKWESYRYIGQPQLYKNNRTGQLLNFIPYWKKKVRGGMLCDEMGLGKTVMSLALIDTHVRKLKKNPQKEAGTLIIVPTIVLTQWQAKVREFLPHLNCSIISKGNHVKKELILKSDIVLTTFGIILSQEKKQKKYQFGQKEYSTLYDFEWFRVIIDEADNLRNQKTKSAEFIRSINKKYVWLLTGTPIQNRLSDLESYFQLLNYKDHGLLKATTKKGFVRNNKSLLIIKQSLKDLMVRRKKDTLDEDGKHILQLKQCKWIYQKIFFTSNQKNVYDGIQGKIVKAIDKIIQEDKQSGQWDQKIPKINMKLDPDVNQEIQHVFGKLMKLRQFCCHPELLYSKSTYIKYQKFPRHFEHFCKNGYDVNTLRNFSSDRRVQEKQIFRRIFLNSDQIKRQMHKSKVYEKIMQKQRLICTYCQNVIRSGILTPCLHLYCEDCFQHLWIESDKKNKEKFDLGTKKIRTRKFMNCYDSNCNEKIYNRQTLQLPRFNRFNKKIEDIQPNTKIYQLLKMIKETHPHEKLVVYTHFIGMIQILEHTFKTEMITALKLVGHDSISERDEKIKAFREKEHIKVMIISTKCGYAGLNLEMANKLYFMDPWWNPAVEDQAMGRLHRYGQENEVEATRFIIEGSIEEVINLMGNQKKLLSDFVLDSDCSKKRKKKVELLKFFRRMLDAKLKGV